MTDPNTNPVTAPAEHYARFSRPGTITLLVLIVSLGALGLAIALRPDSTLSRWLEQGAWIIPIAATVAAGVLVAVWRKNGRHPGTTEPKALAADERRRHNIDRALRVAFMVTMLAQAPLTVVFALLLELPQRQAVSALAVSTTTLGATVLAAAFLWFDRE